MIPILSLTEDAARVESILNRLRLDPAEVALSKGPRAAVSATVHQILTHVAERGDDALVELTRQFDDSEFTVDQLRVSTADMRAAAERISTDLRDALRRSIAQVREYQTHFLPQPPANLQRPGVKLGMRFTPLDSAGLCVPGGKAAYPSSVVMLAVPAQVAGVKRIVVCTPPSKYGRSDLVLAAYHELGLTEVFNVGGAQAVAAMAFGTKTIAAVDKIVGPGNNYMQMAKRAVSGAVGIDGYLGPSEILTLADESGYPAAIAADLIAQAEHDPGSCFLLTTSASLAHAVVREMTAQSAKRLRFDAIQKALRDSSAIIVDESMDRLISLSDRFAAEHVNLQTRDNAAVLGKLKHAGAVFVGAHSPVAAGDYIAGPSHCLPTNTTARFSSGISVYEFLKRSSVVQYDPAGLTGDAPSIISLANAEHLDGHAASISVRSELIR